jgi:glyoxylase-like metal-dependent hydrolase (beta-lactamase superfamily II)/rhodanese-related sulfurtransferase
MFIQQLYTGCLSEAAYYIEDNGEVAVIDPIRDTQVYIDLAKERNATIKYIFETHFHADFVSGHLELSAKTGAPIVFGPKTETSYKIQVAADGQEFMIGRLKLTVLHTPGHTIESTCYLLHDETGNPYCIFTGDTLFAGDVGRPDLSSGDMGSDELAAMLYKSLQSKIKPLPDHVIVYPAHGPGSSCGKNIGPNAYSTIGEEKQHNYALAAPDMDSFIKAVTDGLGTPPTYFMVNARINKEGYSNLDDLLKKGLTPASAAQLMKWKSDEKELIILDTRHADTFTEGFIPDSIFIGLEGRFAEWAGTILPFDADILLVTEPGKEEESLIRLTRVGFERIIGYLEGGFESWRNAGGPIDLVINIEPDELAMDIPFDDHLVVVDVRNPAEFEEGHVADAVNLPLDKMRNPVSMANLEETDNLYVHCGGGYRSVIATSLMKKQGFHNVRNILGGMEKIKGTSVPLILM